MSQQILFNKEFVTQIILLTFNFIIITKDDVDFNVNQQRQVAIKKRRYLSAS